VREAPPLVAAHAQQAYLRDRWQVVAVESEARDVLPGAPAPLAGAHVGEWCGSEQPRDWVKRA